MMIKKKQNIPTLFKFLFVFSPDLFWQAEQYSFQCTEILFPEYNSCMNGLMAQKDLESIINKGGYL